jgi:hypothetical protein
MLTVLEQKKVERIETEWEDFKSLRRKRRFEYGESTGWLTMLKREEFLDFALRMLNKFKNSKMTYE